MDSFWGIAPEFNTHIYTHTHSHTLTHTHSHTLSHTHTYTLIHTHKHTYTHSITQSYTHIYTHSQTHTHTYTHVYTYIHTHAYTNTHIHTHTHILTHTLINTLKKRKGLLWVSSDYNFKRMGIFPNICLLLQMFFQQTVLTHFLSSRFAFITFNYVYMCTCVHMNVDVWKGQKCQSTPEPGLQVSFPEGSPGLL